MKCFVLSVLVFWLPSNLFAQSHPIKKVDGAYGYRVGESEKQSVWIINGARIRNEVYPEFLYGGNDERYLYVPHNEIWIDNSINAEQYSYTLAHELYERHLMKTRGLSYGEAHDSALSLEEVMRRDDQLECLHHEAILPLVSPEDCDSIQLLEWLPDSIRLHDVYRQHIGIRDSMDIWIVDGGVVQRDVYPDFGLCGDDETYHFIPKGEIWIDGAMSCEETEFSIREELRIRDLMHQGKGYDYAYETAIREVTAFRRKLYEHAEHHAAVEVPTPPDRDFGTGKPQPPIPLK